MSNRLYFNLFATPPHLCNYLPSRQATTVFLDPAVVKNVALYDTLSQYGFRRSGNLLYRPQCDGCEACIPVRVPVQQFAPRRSQRRVWQKNSDLQVVAKPCQFKVEHFKLYGRYLAARHSTGSIKDRPTPHSYMESLSSYWSKTGFYEFRLAQRLVAVAVVDHLKGGLSAVYTFFEPELEWRSLGVYAVLWEIEEAKRLQRDWLYLGYWIQECQKMSYKIEYQPIEIFYQGKWQVLLMDNG